MPHTKEKEMFNTNKAILVKFPAYNNAAQLTNTSTADIYIYIYSFSSQTN